MGSLLLVMLPVIAWMIAEYIRLGRMGRLGRIH